MNKKILHTFFFAPIVSVDETHKMSRMIGNSGKPFFGNNQIIKAEIKQKL